MGASSLFLLIPTNGSRPWGAPTQAGAVASSYLDHAETAKKKPRRPGGVSGAGELGLGRGFRSEICSRGWERSATDLASVEGYETTWRMDGS